VATVLCSDHQAFPLLYPEPKELPGSGIAEVSFHHVCWVWYMVFLGECVSWTSVLDNEMFLTVTVWLIVK